jgi:hypothetical protein
MNVGHLGWIVSLHRRLNFEGATMRSTLKLTGVLLAGFMLAPQLSAANHNRLVGVWKLLSLQIEYQDGSPTRATYGEHPTGYLIFTSEGRMMAVIEAEGRKAPSTDEDRASLLNSMFAYSGSYHIEGDKWITRVDVAWTPAWDGTDQVRTFKLDGDRLSVKSMWQQSPTANSPGSPMARGILMFERVR